MSKKKILVIPMAAMAETAGPGGRCKILAEGFRQAGFDVRTCMAKDVNFIKLEDIPNYELTVPTPMGMPDFSDKYFFPLVQKLGITAKKTVNSFDQVLMFTGNLDKRYLRKSVEDIRCAIRDFKPDVVYSEFNISAMIAAKLENKQLFGTVSYPTRKEYACNPKLAKELNQFLDEVGLTKVNSALDLFDWMDEMFCPSIPELEPFQTKVTFLGSIRKNTQFVQQNDKDMEMAYKNDAYKDNPQKNKVLVYMGNGTVSASKMLREVTKAFRGSLYQVYIASAYLKECESGNIHVAPRWDFGKLWQEVVLFINHGGQNSMVDGLIHGVPQIVIPGKVFERKYNADALENVSAGRILSHDRFCAENIKKLADEVITSEKMKENAGLIGEKLLKAGGIQTIVNAIDQMEKENE